MLRKIIIAHVWLFGLALILNLNEPFIFSLKRWNVFAPGRNIFLAAQLTG